MIEKYAIAQHKLDATLQLKMEKPPPNVNTTTAEYVQEEAEEEKKMYNVRKRKCKM